MKYSCQKSVGGVKSGGVSLHMYFGALGGRGSKGGLKVGIWLPVDVYQWVLHRGGGGPAVARKLIEDGFVKWNEERWEKTEKWVDAKRVVIEWVNGKRGKQESDRDSGRFLKMVASK